MKAQTKTVTVTVDEQTPQDANILAEHIIKVSDAFAAINASKLSKRAIVILIHDLSSGTVGKRDIETILHNAALLKKYFTK